MAGFRVRVFINTIKYTYPHVYTQARKYIHTFIYVILINQKVYVLYICMHAYIRICVGEKCVSMKKREDRIKEKR